MSTHASNALREPARCISGADERPLSTSGKKGPMARPRDGSNIVTTSSDGGVAFNTPNKIALANFSLLPGSRDAIEPTTRHGNSGRITRGTDIVWLPHTFATSAGRIAMLSPTIIACLDISLKIRGPFSFLFASRPSTLRSCLRSTRAWSTRRRSSTRARDCLALSSPDAASAMSRCSDCAPTCVCVTAPSIFANSVSRDFSKT